MKTIIATDLDGTVLFTVRQPREGLIPVDEIASGYMTPTVAGQWSRMAAFGSIVPVTTRSIPQYRRLALPGKPPPYAIVCNGARLLIDGEVDPTWHRIVCDEIARSAVDFTTVWQQATAWHTTYPFKLLRAVEEFFIYFAVEQREEWLTEFAEQAQAWVEPRGWRASLQGRKLYLVPEVLDKAMAVDHLVERLSVAKVYAGGDSLLDAQMIHRADEAIRPCHGELHRIGFQAPNCRVTVDTGMAAGDEIIWWYASRSGLG